MWMWRWQENALDREYAALTQFSHADDASAASTPKSRADYARGAVGIAVDAPRPGRGAGNAAPGVARVNWHERKDMPWILLLFAVVVVLIIVFGIWN